MFHLRVLDGEQAGKDVTTRKSSLLIGRSPRCGLVLEDHLASRMHGEFYFVGGKPYYRDLMSRHGTVLKEKSGRDIEITPLMPEWQVTPGDSLKIGNCTLEIVAASAPVRESDGETGDLTMTVSLDENIEVPTAGGELESVAPSIFTRLIQLATENPTNVVQTRRSLTDALLDAFPFASSVTLIDKKATTTGELRPVEVDDTSKIVSSRNETQPCYSFAVLAEAQRKRSVLCYGSQRTLPDTESCVAASIGSCMCAPLQDEYGIIGFVFICSPATEERSFSARDVHLFAILSSVVTLLLRQAKAARESAKMQELASVGHVLAGFSHDAKNILSSLGSHATIVRNTYPELTGNRSWNYLEEDLHFVRCLVRDTRVRPDAQDLNYCHTHVSDIVEKSLESCLRYYFQQVDRDKIVFHNDCPAEEHVYTDPDMLIIALMNCIKNGIDGTWAHNAARRCHIGVSSKSLPMIREGYSAISVVDDGGGIPEQVLDRLGKEIISTKGDKGTGYGFRSVLDRVIRLNGYVQIATSTEDSEQAPAGTIVSICLPNDSDASRDRPGLLIVDEYSACRKKLGRSQS